MNKDVLNKQISMDDIKNIFSKLKNSKNKKEIIIGILILIYIISVVIIGYNLWNRRIEAKAEYDRKESQYTSLKSIKSEAELKKMIENAELDKAKLESRMIEIKTSSELTAALDDFKKDCPIKWNANDKNESFTPSKSSNKELSGYDIYALRVDSFSVSLDQAVEFFEYVKNYDKIVRVDTFEVSKNRITGAMNGSMRLSFYFKKSEE